MAVLADPQGEWTLADVTEPSRADAFRPLAAGLSLGYTRQIHWVRLTLQPARAGRAVLVLNPPYLDDLQVFLPDAAQPGGHRRVLTGDRVAFAEREPAYRGFAFALDLPDTQPRQAWVRLQTSSTSLLTAMLYDEAAFHDFRAHEYAFHGLFFGLLAAVLLYTVLQGLWWREPAHRAFAAYLLVVLFYQVALQGFGAEFVLPGRPDLADLWVSYGVLAMVNAASWLYPILLGIDRRRTPGIHRLVRVLRVVFLLAVPAPALGLFTEVTPIVLALMQGLGLVLAVHGLRTWHQHGRAERLAVLAVLVSLAQSFALTGTLLGWLSSPFWAVYGNQLVVLPVILALVLALAARAREHQRQRRRADQRTRGALETARRERLARREQGRFIATLSHEIKTPLSTILGASHTLRQRQSREDAVAHARVDRIERSVRRIDALVERFLHQDRLDDESLRLHAAPLDALAAAREAAAQCDQPERVGVKGEPLVLEADGVLLALALNNLLGNALKYSSGPVDLQVRALPGHVVFVVADRGPGIDAELSGDLYGRYVRGPRHSHIPGTGLGLALVRTVAWLHGGEIRHQPRAGGGTEFMMELPLVSALSRSANA